MLLLADGTKATRLFIVFQLPFEVLVAFLPYPHHFPNDAFLINGTQQLCALIGLMLFNTLFEIAFDKTDVVLCVVELLFKVD